jgi:hypothetical protein
MLKPPEIRRKLNLKKRLFKHCKIVKSVEQLLIIKQLDREIKSQYKTEKNKNIRRAIKPGNS